MRIFRPFVNVPSAREGNNAGAAHVVPLRLHVTSSKSEGPVKGAPEYVAVRVYVSP